MVNKRVIPVLTIRNGGLVKTKKFKDEVYIGDPINAIRIFNTKGVDELLVMDIDASKHGRQPNFDYLEKLASECFIPLAYAGGISKIEHVRTLISIGIEKIIFNTAFFLDHDLIKQSVKELGSQSVVVSLDYNMNLFKKRQLYSHAGVRHSKIDLYEGVLKAKNLGVGEIIINSVDRDGTMLGYDLLAIKEITSMLNIPVIASGGAGKFDDLKSILFDGNASGAAAGSLFVFHGKLKGVLVNYLSEMELEILNTLSNDKKF